MKTICKCLAALLACFSFAACGGGGSGSSDACGPFRVFNGEVCEEASSAVVRLNTGRALCTATFVKFDRMLTAAHCVDSAVGGVEIIAANGARMFVSGQQIRLLNAWFSTRDSAFDVAILLVDPAFAIQNGIEPIPVSANIDVAAFVGDEVLIAGLGNISSNQPNPFPFPVSTFMEVTSLGNGIFVAANTESDRTGNACVGDSGAPALYRRPGGDFAAIGVVSRGAFSNDCQADPFTVFSFVGNPAVSALLREFNIELL